MHEGLAGLVQTFGLIIFAWMGATGTALYFINESTHGTLFEISEMRQVKEKTVRQQATQIYAKSGYAGRHELAAHFIEDLMLENNK